MSVVEILVNKPEVEEALRKRNSLEKTELIEWNGYYGDISGSEAMSALFELGASFSTLISKLYIMSIQDWEELQDIYNMYCKLDSNKKSTLEDTSPLQRLREKRGTVLLNRDIQSDKRDFDGVEFSRRTR